MYNFRCRTRIAGGFMIRDYVANQSKDNNKKPLNEGRVLFVITQRKLFKNVVYPRYYWILCILG